MRLKLFVVVLMASGLVPAAALANEPGCCEPGADKCAMACCKHDQLANADGCCEPGVDKCVMPHSKHDQPADDVELLLSLGGGLTTADELMPPPVRQRAVVWFHRPVWVGRNVLMGKYIIEHDTARRALYASLRGGRARQDGRAGVDS